MFGLIFLWILIAELGDLFSDSPGLFNSPKKILKNYENEQRIKTLIEYKQKNIDRLLPNKLREVNLLITKLQKK